MGRILALVFAATVIAAITAYGAGSVTPYMVQPFALTAGPRLTITAEPQTSNRPAKGNRVALLLDSPSYTDFSPSLLALSITSGAVPADLRADLPGTTRGLLNDAQIAGIERRLRLTPQQAEYWPAVADVLRDIGRRYFSPRQARRAAEKLHGDSAEVRRLMQAGTPLIALMTDEQKREVRQLVRIIGLEAVASRI